MYKKQTFKNYYFDRLRAEGYTVKESKEIIKKESMRDIKKEKIKEEGFLKKLNMEYSLYKDANLSADKLIKRYFKQLKVKN